MKKKKKLLEKVVEKGEIGQNEQVHLFPQCFPCNPLKATFQLTSASSLNLGQSQNGVLGNGLY